ncbi:hypothetical protein [Luteolibacter luteus]|uniref:Uncharacterized protein n=1 Tax=Luteolibacter luteus TaxID=2728835 RepID=A0A858RJ69_9BACT|nr:hypothetical protein [Luteolibacter luteus]QJE96765.1 hypothetical protein HHL09_13555 [Luteolibacter luteus]
MKALPSYLAGAAIFGICAITAWSLRGVDETKQGSRSSSSTTDRKASKTTRGSRREGVPAEVTQRLAEIRAGRTVEERLRATLQLAESIPIEDIGKWFKEGWFDGREDMQTYYFHRIALGRWLKEDPKGLMSYCLQEKSDHTYYAARAFAKQDPAAALAYASEIKSPEKRSQFLSSIGETLGKADPQLAFEAISKLSENAETMSNGSLLEMIRGISVASPEFLKGKIDQLPAALQRQAREYLTTSLLKKNFAATVAELEKSPDGKRSFVSAIENDYELVKEAIKDPRSLPEGWFADAASQASYYLVRDDPKRWLDEDLAALGLNEDQAQHLRSQALNQLAQKDPEALKTLLAGQELTARERNSAVGAMTGALSKDREKAEAWIATLTDPSEITIAKSVLTHNQSDSKGTTPASLISDLLADGSSVTWSQARAAGTWSSEERAAAAKEFAALPAEQKEGVAQKLMTNHYDQLPATLRAEAVRYLIQNKQGEAEAGGPQGNPLVQAAATQGARWAEDDPVAGSRWIDSLPQGTERLWAAKNFAARWVDYEPTEARKWISALPAEERAQVQKYIESGEAYR